MIITECKFCGARETEVHQKYTDRCLDCGRTYGQYKNYQSLQRSKPTASRQALLDQLTFDYKVRKQAGYKVPRDIE